jgi:hypothetical protein
LAADGATLLPNTVGIRLEFTADNNVIGGTGPHEANVIAGSDRGLWIGAGSSNLVVGNYIGTDGSGAMTIGNRVGVRIDQGGPYEARDNQVGPGNVIAYNTAHGLLVGTGSDTTGNTITQNSITANGDGSAGKGIILEPGANGGIEPPVLISATATEVSGTSTAPEGSLVEIFRDAGDQGREYLGTTTVSGGTFTWSGAAAGEGNLTATVTDPSWNTSEFSDPIPAPGPTADPEEIVETVLATLEELPDDAFYSDWSRRRLTRRLALVDRLLELDVGWAAVFFLERIILPTMNGCVERGEPDTGFPRRERDAVTDCSVQEPLHSLIVSAIEGIREEDGI